MPLIDVSELRPHLRCPQCGHGLTGDRCPKCGTTYPSVGDHLVLADFERSILDRAAIESGASSAVPRSTRRARFGGRNEAAERNTARLLAEVAPEPLVLVVGGGSIGKGLERLYEDARIVAFDIYESPNIQLIADAHQIPLPDEMFDAVIVQAVLEHVLEPAQVVAEIWRVLKSGGLVYAETPFMQQVHEGAYDFQRFTESGHRWLFRRFARIDSGVVAGPGYQLVWTIDYLVRGLFRSRRAGMRTRHLTSPLSRVDTLIPAAYQIDAASATYFLGAKSERELAARDIVTHYLGAQ